MRVRSSMSTWPGTPGRRPTWYAMPRSAMQLRQLQRTRSPGAADATPRRWPPETRPWTRRPSAGPGPATVPTTATSSGSSGPRTTCASPMRAATRPRGLRSNRSRLAALSGAPARPPRGSCYLRPSPPTVHGSRGSRKPWSWLSPQHGGNRSLRGSRHGRWVGTASVEGGCCWRSGCGPCWRWPATILALQVLASAWVAGHDADLTAIIMAEVYVALLAALALAFGGPAGLRDRLAFRFTSAGHLALVLPTWLGALVAGLLATAMLSPWLGPPESNTAPLLSTSFDPLFVGIIVPTVCLLGPACEEMLFRGALYGWLRRRVPLTRMTAPPSHVTAMSLSERGAPRPPPLRPAPAMPACDQDRGISACGPCTPHAQSRSEQRDAVRAAPPRLP